MKKILVIALVFSCMQGFAQEAVKVLPGFNRPRAGNRYDTVIMNFIGSDTVPLTHVSKEKFVDTVEFDKQVSYNSNQASNFTRYSHVDKNYTDSAILAHASASPVVFSQTASGTALTNTTTGTTITGSGVGLTTLATNSAAVGQVITLDGWGILSTAASPGTLTITYGVGGTVVVSTFTPPASLSAVTVHFRGSATVLTTGSSGTGAIVLEFDIPGSSPVIVTANSTGSMNTTTGLSVQLTGQWGTASASNSLQTIAPLQIKQQ